jgi:hypothetical protein
MFTSAPGRRRAPDKFYLSNEEIDDLLAVTSRDSIIKRLVELSTQDGILDELEP